MYSVCSWYYTVVSIVCFVNVRIILCIVCFVLCIILCIVCIVYCTYIVCIGCMGLWAVMDVLSTNIVFPLFCFLTVDS